MSNTIAGSTQQIVTAYEDNGLTPEQIVEAFEGEFDLVAIKAVLCAYSGKYRELMNSPEAQVKEKPGFSEDDERFALQGIRTLAEYAEEEHIRAKMLVYIREDRQGRRDAVSKLGQGGGGNIYLLQQFISKGNEALKVTEKKAIDIVSKKVA